MQFSKSRTQGSYERRKNLLGWVWWQQGNCSPAGLLVPPPPTSSSPPSQPPHVLGRPSHEQPDGKRSSGRFGFYQWMWCSEKPLHQSRCNRHIYCTHRPRHTPYLYSGKECTHCELVVPQRIPSSPDACGRCRLRGTKAAKGQVAKRQAAKGQAARKVGRARG